MRRIVQSDKEEVQPSSCCYCIIPCPQYPGEGSPNPSCAPSAWWQILTDLPSIRWTTSWVLSPSDPYPSRWSGTTLPRIDRATRTVGPALPGSSLRHVMYLHFLGGLSADWVPQPRALKWRVPYATQAPFGSTLYERWRVF
jgi:hypothetical protein